MTMRSARAEALIDAAQVRVYLLQARQARVSGNKRVTEEALDLVAFRLHGANESLFRGQKLAQDLEGWSRLRKEFQEAGGEELGEPESGKCAAG